MYRSTQGYTNPGRLFIPAAKFYTVVPDIFTIIRTVFLPYSIWYQFTCTEQKAPGSIEAHVSLRNY